MGKRRAEKQGRRGQAFQKGQERSEEEVGAEGSTGWARGGERRKTAQKKRIQHVGPSPLYAQTSDKTAKNDRSGRESRRGRLDCMVPWKPALNAPSASGLGGEAKETLDVL